MVELLPAIASVLWPLVAAWTVWVVRHELRAKHRAALDEQPPVPEDLMAYAMSHSEQWAQQDAMRAIQQSFDTWKDWNRVRAAIGIGRID